MVNEVSAAATCDALFVGAHPDDVELFCGGTIARLAHEGYRVMLADLSRGESASNGTPQQRREDSLAAAATLGVLPERPVLGLPDGGIDARAEDQLAAVIALLRRVRPTLLVAPWLHDRHPDHEAAGALVRRACFFAGVRNHRPDLGAAHRPARLVFAPCHHDVPVQLLVDVSATMDSWRRAVKAYRTQFDRSAAQVPTPINRPGFLEAAEGRRAHWGNLGGVAFAEGFVLEGPWLATTAQLLSGGSPR